MVTSDGVVDYYGSVGGYSSVYNSYGILRSPGTGGFDANYAWNVDKSGNIPLFSDHENSYGHTFILSPAIDTEADSIFYIATDGGAYISDYISTYSYGYKMLRSPITDWYGGAYYVYSDGVVYDYSGSSYYVTDSYGNLLSGHPLQYCMVGWIEWSM